MYEPCRVELLGGLRIRLGDRTITRFSTQKTGAVLAYLAYHPNKAHSREVMTAMLWSAFDSKAARMNFSKALSSLRQQLEPPGVPAGAVIVANRFNVQLNPAAVTTDVAEFEAAVREAETAPAALAKSVEIYTGPLLPGYYEDWVLAERLRLEAAYVGVLRRLIVILKQSGSRERAIDCAHRIVATDPLVEEAHADLITLYIEAGRTQEATRQYKELERILERELGIAPSPATRELLEQHKHTFPERHRVTPASAACDIDTPAIDIKPPTPVTEQASLTARLPLQFTRFFGREEEIASLAEMLTPGTPSSHRIVTLSGPGGVGKTRLAVEVAGRQTEAFGQAVWFVPLADILDPTLMAGTIGDTLRLPRSANQTPLEQVVEFLNRRDAPALLVLDNLEQIADQGALTVLSLISRVPLLTCLVTSRSRLEAPGEQEFPIAPLPIPPADLHARDRTFEPQALLSYSSVALFVERARTARPDFQVTARYAGDVAELCRILEGLPLAIELAAARAQSLSPAQIRERLSKRFELLTDQRADKDSRHRSLWVVMDWSYDLLTPEQQRFFAHLSVFRGGWTIKAAGVVCGDESRALATLMALRANSLVLVEDTGAEARFRMLETLREYAQERLGAAALTEAKCRHADYFRAFAEEAEPELKVPARDVWLQRLAMEHDNLRAALDWLLSASASSPNVAGAGTVGSGAAEAALRMAVSLFQFWALHGHFLEGREWLERALMQSDKREQTLERMKALTAAGCLAREQGDYTRARTCLTQSLAIARESGNKRILAVAVCTLGLIAREQGDYDEARRLGEEDLALSRDTGRLDDIAISLGNLACVRCELGDYWEACALHEEALQTWRTIGDPDGLAITLNDLGDTLLRLQEFDSAHACLEESLSLKRETKNQKGVSATLHNLGALARAKGDYSSAWSYIRESLEIRRDLGDKRGLCDSLNATARLAATHKRYRRAALLYGAEAALREAINTPGPPDEQAEQDATLAVVRAKLGEGAFTVESAKGRTMSLEQAVVYALNESNSGN